MCFGIRRVTPSIQLCKIKVIVRVFATKKIVNLLIKNPTDFQVHRLEHLMIGLSVSFLAIQHIK